MSNIPQATAPKAQRGDSRIAFQVDNERHLETLRSQGTDVRSFDGWRMAGRWVKRGQKQRAYRVKVGMIRCGINPITGEDHFEPKFVTVYGFAADQVN